MALIDQILVLTEQVQQFVDNGRWIDAGALETERLALLTELFEHNSIADLGPECEQLVRDLLTRNTQMIAKMQVQRTQLNETTRQLLVAPCAVDAYRSNVTSAGWDVSANGQAAGTVE